MFAQDDDGHEVGDFENEPFDWSDGIQMKPSPEIPWKALSSSAHRRNYAENPSFHLGAAFVVADKGVVFENEMLGWKYAIPCSAFQSRELLHDIQQTRQEANMEMRIEGKSVTHFGKRSGGAKGLNALSGPTPNGVSIRNFGSTGWHETNPVQEHAYGLVRYVGNFVKIASVKEPSEKRGEEYLQHGSELAIPRRLWDALPGAPTRSSSSTPELFRVAWGKENQRKTKIQLHVVAASECIALWPSLWGEGNRVRDAITKSGPEGLWVNVYRDPIADGILGIRFGGEQAQVSKSDSRITSVLNEERGLRGARLWNSDEVIENLRGGKVAPPTPPWEIRDGINSFSMQVKFHEERLICRQPRAQEAQEKKIAEEYMRHLDKVLDGYLTQKEGMGTELVVDAFKMAGNLPSTQKSVKLLQDLNQRIACLPEHSVVRLGATNCLQNLYKDFTEGLPFDLPKQAVSVRHSGTPNASASSRPHVDPRGGR